MAAPLFVPLLLLVALNGVMPGSEKDSPSDKAGESPADRSPGDWAGLLSHDDYGIRERVTFELVTMRPVDIELLTGLCVHSDLEIAWRARAATEAVFPAMRHSQGEQLVAELRGYLDDSDASIRERVSALLFELRACRAEIEKRLSKLGLTVSDLKDGTKQARFKSRIAPDEQLFVQLGSIADLSVLNMETQPVNDQQLQFLQYLPTLQKIYLMGTQVSGEGLRHLGTLQDLNGLSLRKLQLDDEAWQHVGRLEGLLYLGLDETNVTDEGLQKISQLNNLKQLWLNDTRITDDGLKSLGKLTNLEKLILTRIPIDGSGIEELAGLSKLKYLSLEGCQIDDSAAIPISKLRSLETLGLDGTNVSDRTVAEIRELKKLKVLWLAATKVTDRCVDDLLEMSQLERLVLYDCRISQENIRKLKDELPTCVVEFKLK